MRRSTFSVLALSALGLSLGCEADSSGLGDGGLGDATLADVPDGGGPVDVGTTDAGTVDAGPADTGPVDAGPPPACAGGRTFQMDVRGMGPSGYEGIMVGAPTGRIGLATADGQGIVFFDGETPQVLFSEPSFFARVEIYTPFWSEVRITLWRVAPGGGPGTIALVAWSGGSFGGGGPMGVEYAYTAQGCTASADECGRTVGLRLEAEVQGEAAAVAYGTHFAGPTYDLFNGRSSRFVEGPFCTDTPNSWYEGWIAVDSPPQLPCAQMQRDDCIADPRCVLWGSENYDPGYVCMDASGECERLIDPDDCSRNPTCVNDPGGCYCPEGFDCICAGGPAPKCRSICGGFGGLSCPGGRYCDPLGLQAPDQCGPVPDGAGQCEWAPTGCAGAPHGPVCACGNNGAQSFDNDCLRRQVQAAGPVPGACPP